MGVSEYRRIGVCNALSISRGPLGRCRGVARRFAAARRRPADTFPLAPALVLGAFLLLGACSSTDSAKKDDPVFFGQAGGGNGGGGAVSGMSLRW